MPGYNCCQLADVTEIVDAFKRYAQGQIKESVKRRNLCKRKQQPGESVDDYMVDLRELVKTCNFCTDTCIDKALRDQLIEGLRDDDTVEDLLKIHPLSLAVAVDTARACESAKKNLKDVTGGA